MLATTIQITNNPPHTPHTQKKTPSGWLRRQPPPTQAADAHTVLNVNPTVCSSASNTYAQPKTHPHPPPTNSDEQMQAQENKATHPQNADAPLVPHKNGLPRKEVIQPHLPVRLPCYDFVPIANPTFDHSPQTVRPWASGVTNFRDVTGGVYKARERIHRSVADLRLLATPPSWGRVADPNPN